jgi:hypothetical protein
MGPQEAETGLMVALLVLFFFKGVDQTMHGGHSRKIFQSLFLDKKINTLLL